MLFIEYKYVDIGRTFVIALYRYSTVHGKRALSDFWVGTLIIEEHEHELNTSPNLNNFCPLSYSRCEDIINVLLL